MGYFPSDIPFMSHDELIENGINIPKDNPDDCTTLNNQVNLCDSCTYTYPECPSEKDDVIFGNGIGNDNICACNKYQPTVQPVSEILTHKSQPTKITNLEYIKTCSKEKLARFLCDEFGLDCGDCIAKEYCYYGHNGFIDWLSIERE